jgi:hypothetical protein
MFGFNVVMHLTVWRRMLRNPERAAEANSAG